MKKLLIGLLLGMGVVMGVQAEDIGVNIDGKNIVVTEATNAFGSEEKKIHSKDLQNAIYVEVATIGGDEFKNLSLLAKERFALKGFKVTDSPVGASVKISLNVTGSINMSDANKRADYSSLPTGSLVVVNGGAAIGTAISSGLPGLVGFALGGLYPSDIKASINGTVYIKPVEKTTWRGLKVFVSENNFINMMRVFYKLEKDKEASDDTAFKMLVDQWINRYMVLDAESAMHAILPVSAVAATTN